MGAVAVGETVEGAEGLIMLEVIIVAAVSMTEEGTIGIIHRDERETNILGTTIARIHGRLMGLLVP